MKRQRSHGDDLGGSGGGGERNSWERSSSSSSAAAAGASAAGASASHRRFYARPDDSRRGGFERDRDEEWVPPLPRRRDFDERHSRGSDWKRGFGFDRHWDHSPWGPRRTYGREREGDGDRGVRRSESFGSAGGLRAEFPKRFRSEREQSRRHGSPWWKSSGNGDELDWYRGGSGVKPREPWPASDSIRRCDSLKKRERKEGSLTRQYGEHRELSYNPDSKHTVIAGADNMQRLDLPRLSEPFQRSPSSAKEIVQGASIGEELSYARKEVESKTECSLRDSNDKLKELAEVNGVVKVGDATLTEGVDILDKTQGWQEEDAPKLDVRGTEVALGGDGNGIIMVNGIAEGASPKGGQDLLPEEGEVVVTPSYRMEMDVLKSENMTEFDQEDELEVVAAGGSKELEVVAAGGSKELEVVAGENKELEGVTGASMELEVVAGDNKELEVETGESMELEVVAGETKESEAVAGEAREELECDANGEEDGEKMQEGGYELKEGKERSEECDDNQEEIASTCHAEMAQASNDLVPESAGVTAENKNTYKDANMDFARDELTVENQGNGLVLETLGKDNCKMEMLEETKFANLWSESTKAESSHHASEQVDEHEDALEGGLDLSLSLPGSLVKSVNKCSTNVSEYRARAGSLQYLPLSSMATESDGFVASLPVTKAFGQNSGCSLSQHSLDINEHSTVSKPIVRKADKVPNGTSEQAQLSNGSGHKGRCVSSFQSVLLNGNHNQPSAVSPLGLGPSASITKRNDVRKLAREGSSNTSRSDSTAGDQLVLNGVGVIDRIIEKIVAEPLHLAERLLKEMTKHSLAYLKEAICEFIVNADRATQIAELQGTLRKRSDLTSETLKCCSHVLLEMLTVLKTGIPDFIKRGSTIAADDLIEIIQDMKCHNLACGNILPVDDCDCSICEQRKGFCSSCMCIVCSKFDSALNTCSWVGCDGCLHWCHTDCALRQCLIRRGSCGSQTNGTNEMQFHCFACGYPSEMFGFVKEVFLTCAKQWKQETLVKELQFIKRIFSSSDDVRGKRLCNIVNQVLDKLQDGANHSDILKALMTFFSDGEQHAINNPLPTKLQIRGSGMACDEIPRSSMRAGWSMACDEIPRSSIQAGWSTTAPREKLTPVRPAVVPRIEESAPMVGKVEAELRKNTEKKGIINDELDNLVKFKQAEAMMYQERANDALKAAESLRNIVISKTSAIDQDFSSQVAALKISELEERRKKKLDDLQATELAYNQYSNMTSRIEGAVKELLLKLEAAKRCNAHL